MKVFCVAWASVCIFWLSFVFVFYCMIMTKLIAYCVCRRLCISPWFMHLLGACAVVVDFVHVAADFWCFVAYVQFMRNYFCALLYLCYYCLGSSWFSNVAIVLRRIGLNSIDRNALCTSRTAPGTSTTKVEQG